MIKGYIVSEIVLTCKICKAKLLIHIKETKILSNKQLVRIINDHSIIHHGTVIFKIKNKLVKTRVAEKDMMLETMKGLKKFILRDKIKKRSWKNIQPILVKMQDDGILKWYKKLSSYSPESLNKLYARLQVG